MTRKFTLADRMAEYVSPEPTSGCWLWTGGVTPGGYGSTHSNGKWMSAHRASWELNRGPIPDGLFVLHKCDVRTCVNPDHLFLGTHADNALDRVTKGRNGDTGALPGELNHQAKLNRYQVAVIRAFPESRGCATVLARAFGVSIAAVSMIRSGHNWRE